MTFWVELIIGVLRILLPAFIDAGTPRQEDARPQPELRRKLQERIRRTWGMTAVLLLALTCVGCAGYGRTVYVPAGEPVRLRETIKGAKVWVMGADGKPLAGTMDLPVGWYCLPLEGDTQ